MIPPVQAEESVRVPSFQSLRRTEQSRASRKRSQHVLLSGEKNRDADGWMGGGSIDLCVPNFHIWTKRQTKETVSEKRLKIINFVIGDSSFLSFSFLSKLSVLGSKTL